VVPGLKKLGLVVGSRVAVLCSLWATSRIALGLKESWSMNLEDWFVMSLLGWLGLY